MAMGHCLVCGAQGDVTLGIRARYRNTNAVWAPNLEAYLCLRHALSGNVIDINYRATSDGRVRVNTTSVNGRHSEVVLKIDTEKYGQKEIPGQEGLFE